VSLVCEVPREKIEKSTKKNKDRRERDCGGGWETRQMKDKLRKKNQKRKGTSFEFEMAGKKKQRWGGGESRQKKLPS